MASPLYEGFQMGRQMVADFRETQELLKQRRIEEEYKAEMSQLQEQQKAHAERFALAKEDYEALQAQRGAGYAVDEKEENLAAYELTRRLREGMDFAMETGSRLHLSANPLIAAKGKEILDQAHFSIAQLQAQHQAAEQNRTVQRGQDIQSDTAIETEGMRNATTIEAQGMQDETSLEIERMRQRGENQRAKERNEQDKTAEKARAGIALLQLVGTMGEDEAAKNEQVQGIAKQLGLPPLKEGAFQAKLTEERAAEVSKAKDLVKMIEERKESGTAAKRDDEVMTKAKRRIKQLEDEQREESYSELTDDRGWVDRWLGVPHPNERGDNSTLESARKQAIENLARLGPGDIDYRGPERRQESKAATKPQAPARQPQPTADDLRGSDARTQSQNNRSARDQQDEMDAELEGYKRTMLRDLMKNGNRKK